jgi:hypothetical protein
MFKEHYDTMRPGPTPERVLTVCKLLIGKGLTEDELKDQIYLEKTAATKIGEEFRRSIQAAQELGLISLKDGVYTLAVKEEQISTNEAFRRTVAKRAFANKKSTFFRVSHWYVDSNERILNFLNWEDKAAAATNAGIDRVDNNDFLGWRFWAGFLGLGYLHGTELIPNMYIRVRDILATEFTKTFSFGEEIPADRFFRWLWTLAPESKTEDNSVNLALSSAIRTLRDTGEVAPVALMDAIPMYLYSLPEDSTNKITHIIVKEDVCK